MYLRADPQLATLADFALKPVFAAEDGERGKGSLRTGRSGADIFIDVPCGTQIYTHPRGDSMTADLLEPGQTLLVARGGRGGRGNKAFATATYQAPHEAERGQPGEEATIDLELKLIADVGLVGLPNAGKSTLLRRLSRARPKVAPYPFTTLHPHLGICDVDEERRLVIADIPGLIEGAHEGAGLGHEFLRHIERTVVVAHLVSCESGTIEGCLSAWRTVETELASYSEALAAKGRVIVLTKLDLLAADDGARLAGELSNHLGAPVRGISAVTGLGIGPLVEAFYHAVRG